jgi:hypothetical protein
MGFYEDRPPRHGHRTPSELAEDEILSALHGDYCGMPARPEQTGPTSHRECLQSTGVALLPWADAHPFAPALRDRVVVGTARQIQPKSGRDQ